MKEKDDLRKETKTDKNRGTCISPEATMDYSP